MDEVSYGKDKATLSVCSCGKLHFRYGGGTLHFEPDDFLAFGGSVASLLSQFRRVRETQLPPSLSGTIGSMCH